MNYNVRLDSADMDRLADYLLQYADDFEDKVRMFLSRLADLGIEVASANGGDFGSYIVYSKTFDDDTTVRMIAKDSQAITNSWYVSSTSQTLRQETISPVLMAEFGSAQFAEVLFNISGVGQGTFDANGWYWWSDDTLLLESESEIVSGANGRYKFHSRGVHPAQPLHKAVMACIEQVTGIAKEVFA